MRAHRRRPCNHLTRSVLPPVSAVADDEEEDVGSHQRANDILSGMLSRSGSEASNANIEVARAAANRPLSHRDGSGHSVLSDSQRA